MITGTIHDVPTMIPTLDNSCLPFITAMNQAWWNNSIQLGIFCLVVGFLIGAGVIYFRYGFRESEDFLIGWDK
jgi:hypothetical protein